MSVPVMVMNVPGRAEEGLTVKLLGVPVLSFLQPIYNKAVSRQSTVQLVIRFFMMRQFKV
jgi:hypothetical protein